MYVIRQTREYYGPSTRRQLVPDGSGWRAATYATRAAARAAAAERAALDINPRTGLVELAHNEAAPPRYDVLPAHRLPAYLAQAL